MGGGSGHSVAQGSYRSINRCSDHKTTQEMRWRYRRKNPESIRTLQAVFMSIFVKKSPCWNPSLAGMLQANLDLFRHSKSLKLRSRGVGRSKSTQEFTPHAVTTFPGWFCSQNISRVICKSYVQLESRPPPSVNYPRNRLHL